MSDNTSMSNLKKHFTSKLTSVIVTEKKGGYVYTGSFADGSSAVIRTSRRQYASVTQIRLDSWQERDADGVYHKVDRTDFLFSAKPSPSLGKNEQHRVVATVQVNTGASAPVPRKQVCDEELAKYQPQIILDAITNALQKPSHEAWISSEQHRLEHSGDGDCDRHPNG